MNASGGSIGSWSTGGSETYASARTLPLTDGAAFPEP